MRLFTFSAAILLLCSASASADDWPQWLGPQRDSIWREDGIVDRFPKSGLKIKWRKPVAYGYAGPAVADGKVFVMDYVLKSGKISNIPNVRDKLDGTERVLCFDAATGKEIWRHEYDCEYNISYPAGPRCTPTVDGNRVYTLGAEGNLFCLNVKNGKVIWSKDFAKDYEAETPIWGHAAHPLVDEKCVYCVVGGPGSVAVAFNKMNGKEVWKALSAKPQGYCAPTMIEHGGTRQLLIYHPKAVNSLDPNSGKPYWSVQLEPDYNMAITVPRLAGDYLYVSGYNSKSVLLKLDSNKPAATVIKRGKPKTYIYCDNCAPIIEDGVIYAVDAGAGMLMAANLLDGKRLWETAKATTGAGRALHATAFLVKNQDRFFIFSETGHLILAKLSPQGYNEIDRFQLLEPTNSTFGRKVVWSHPAFAQRCVFARNDKELVCVNLAAGH